MQGCIWSWISFSFAKAHINKSSFNCMSSHLLFPIPLNSRFAPVLEHSLDSSKQYRYHIRFALSIFYLNHSLCHMELYRDEALSNIPLTERLRDSNRYTHQLARLPLTHSRTFPVGSVHWDTVQNFPGGNRDAVHARPTQSQRYCWLGHNVGGSYLRKSATAG